MIYYVLFLILWPVILRGHFCRSYSFVCAIWIHCAYKHTIHVESKGKDKGHPIIWVEVWFYSFFNLSDTWVSSYLYASAALPPKKRASIHFTGGWVGPQMDSNLGSPSWCSRFTDWTNPAHRNTRVLTKYTVYTVNMFRLLLFYPQAKMHEYTANRNVS